MLVITKLNTTLEDNVLYKNLIENTIKELIKMFKLNVESLDRIVFTSQFDDELKYLKYFTKSKADISYTNNSTSTAIAKVVKVVINNETKFIIVGNETIPSYLQSSERNEQSFGIHLLHHELSHIHDYYNLCEFDKILLKYKFEPRDRYYIDISHRIWSEFFANFNSFQTVTEDLFNMAITNFIDGLSIINDSILLNKLRYQKKIITLEEFDYILLRDTEFLYSSIAYLSGYIVAYKDGNKNTNINFQGIEGHLFEEFAKEIPFILEEMLNKYPYEWSTIEVFDKLKENIFKFYKKIGIIIENTYYQGKETSYMHVSFIEYDLPLDTI